MHGSAPEIAGQDRANPYGAILSVALLLRHSLRAPDLAAAVEAAVDACIDDGVLTADLGGTREHGGGGRRGGRGAARAGRRAAGAPS